MGLGEKTGNGYTDVICLLSYTHADMQYRVGSIIDIVTKMSPSINICETRILRIWTPNNIPMQVNKKNQ